MSSTWRGPSDKYRLTKQSKPWDLPKIEVKEEDLSQAQWENGKRKLPVAEIVFSILSLLGLTGIIILSLYEGHSKSNIIMGALVAGVPLIVVLSTLLFLDRWAPEPKLLLFATFAWGMGVATVVSLVLNTSGAIAIVEISGAPQLGTVSSAVFMAPFIEELTKFIGPLIIILLRRNVISSSLDVLVYGGVTAAGFAFTENIIYFTRLDLNIGVIVLRGIFSPFAHVLFTSCTALALGIALTRSRSKSAWTWITPIGYAGAVLLHMIWNGTSSVSGGLFVIVYLIFQVPLFISWVVLMIVLSMSIKKEIKGGIVPFARAGWFNLSEVNMFTSRPMRRQAISWAKTQSHDCANAMRAFQKTATELACFRAMSMRLGDPQRLVQIQQELLSKALLYRSKMGISLSGDNLKNKATPQFLPEKLASRYGPGH